MTAGTSSRRPVKTTRWAIRSSRAWASSASRRLPSPTISRYASGTARRTAGHASSSVGWPFSGSSRATTPDDLRAGLHAVLLGERAARLLVVVALEVHAVVDEADRDASPGPRRSSLASIALRDRDELVDRRASARSSAARSSLGADPARVDRRRRGTAAAGRASPSAMTARRADDLGAVHVGVDDVGADLGQVRRQGADRDRVVGLVDDEDRDAGALELADGAAGRQRRRPRRRSASGPSG